MWGDNNADAGYMNDSIVAEPSRLTNTVAVGGEDRNRLTMPVSLSQIAGLTRPDEGLVIHGQKAAVVTVVARIVETLESSLHKLQYLINDFTNGGPLEVLFIRSDVGLPGSDARLTMFNDDGTPLNPEETPQKELVVDDYIRVYGQVKFSNEKAQIMAYKIMPVIDPNEISMHILEVVRESLYAEKSQSGTLPFQTNTNSKGNNGLSDYVQPGAAATFGLETLPNLEKHIIQVIQKAPRPEEGMHVDEIANHLRGVARADIRKAIEFLQQEGHLWHGASEEYYCVS